MYENLLKPADLAEKLNVSIRTLRRWEAKGIGPNRIKCGHFIGYRPEAVKEWLKQNEEGASNE